MEGSMSLDSNKQCIVRICEGISGSRWKKITENALLKAEVWLHISRIIKMNICA